MMLRSRYVCKPGSWLLGLLLMLAGGCGNQDFQSFFSTMEKPGDVNTQTADDAEETKKLLDTLLKATSTNATASTAYHIGTADTLEIAIVALQTPGQTTSLKRKPDKAGFIELPMIGKISAVPLTTDELQATIIAAYKDKYLKNPDVTVSVADYQSAGVWITGAVGTPGIHYLKRDRTTILELLAEVGGVQPDAGKKLMISRGHPVNRSQPSPTSTSSNAAIHAELESMKNEVATDRGRLEIDIKALLESGDPRWNVTVGNGDYITVPLAKDNFINVLGYVRSPGTFAITREAPITAWRALAKAGGPNDQGRAEKCFIIRESSNGKRTPIAVNIKDIIYGKEKDFPMQAGDTLVVGAPFYMKIKDIFSVGASAGADYTAPVQ